MVTDAHLIGRLDFTASVADLDMALALRLRLEEFAWRMMPRVIERVCDAVAPPDMHLRVDRIDLDLGRVRPEHLEEDALTALESALGEALGKALHGARHAPSDAIRLVPGPAMRLERFEIYLATGRTPLAARGERFDPLAQLDTLAKEQPQALMAMLRDHARDRHFLERLVLQVGGEGLRRLLALLAPADAAAILALVADVILAHRAEPLAGMVRVGEPALERMLWVATFEFLLRDAGSQFNRRRFLEFLLRREARGAGVDYAALLKVLGTVIEQLRGRTGFRSSLPVVLAELLAELPPEPSPSPEATPVTDEPGALAAAREGDLEPLLALVRARLDDRPALEALVRGLDAELFAALIRRIEPANAALILTILDDLVIVHRDAALPVLPEAELEVRVRAVALRYLLRDAGTQFNRRRFLGHLLEQEAERAGVEFAVILQIAADAVEQVRARTGLRASLPMVLNELIAEQVPARVSARDPVAEALAAARAGDAAALLALLQERVRDRADFETLARELTPALFEAVLREARPAHAAAMIEDLDALASLHRAEPALLLSPTGFEQLSRAIALRALLEGPARFARPAWRVRVIEGLAETGGMAPAALRAAFARAAVRVGGKGLIAELTREFAADDAAIAHLAELAEGDLLARVIEGAAPGAAAVLLRRAAGEPARLMRLGEGIDERERTRLLGALDPGNALAVAEELRLLQRLHAASPLARLDGARFAALAWALAVGWLAGLRSGRFDRRALGRHLLDGIARHGGVAQSDLAAELRRGLARVSSDDAAAAGELTADYSREHAPGGGAEVTDRRRALAHFLRTGHPPLAGRALATLSAADRAWVAALVRKLVRETPASAPALIDRLLEWLLPEELVELLMPGAAARALRWADVAGGGIEAWREIAGTLVRDEAPAFTPAPGGPGKRLDRLALIAHWFDHDGLAWWSPRGTFPADLLADLSTYSPAELGWLFLGRDPARAFDRLRRAAALMTPAQRHRLIARIAPWAAQTDGALAAVLAGMDESGRLDAQLRAVAAALQGVELDLAALGTPPPDPAAATPEPSPVPREKVDLARLLAWLDGAPAGTAEREALVRLFARLADAGAAALADWFAAHRDTPEARARWARLLPPEALGRIVHLYLPAGARAWIDALLVLQAAARRVLDPPPAPERVWALLFDQLALPGPADLPRGVGAMIEGLAKGDSRQAARLREAAAKLAQDGGHAALGVALRRDLPRRPPATLRELPPMPTPPPLSAAEDEAPLLDEPRGAIFIENAGLVLLNPYLHPLFERLGLFTQTEEGPRIKGIEALSRGVHLLQYMIDGRTDAPEPGLVLNKLLCGAATAQPIEPAIEATEQEREICDGLLHAIIANWTIMRGSSIEALRQTFLQREGRLLRGEDRWSLHVQRKGGIDVMIDQLPWSFATVYHRWMAEPIHVTW